METRKHTDVIRALLPPSGQRLLDVGCGDGALTRFLARNGAQATGIDISEPTLARARAAEAVPGADYMVGVGEKLPFPDRSVDAVIYMNALHHVPMPSIGAALAEALRVLRPGGRLLVIEPLANGAHFELGRQIDDETEVRDAAYRALSAVPAGLRMETEKVYDAPIRYKNFTEWEARMRGVDPARGPRVDANRERLTADFARLASPDGDGVKFAQPTRANLLVKTG